MDNHLRLENKQSVRISTGTLEITISQSYTGNASYVTVVPHMGLELTKYHDSETRLVVEVVDDTRMEDRTGTLWGVQ
jgi:hypothetical protein